MHWKGCDERQGTSSENAAYNRRAMWAGGRDSHGNGKGGSGGGGKGTRGEGEKKRGGTYVKCKINEQRSLFRHSIGVEITKRTSAMLHLKQSLREPLIVLRGDEI